MWISAYALKPDKISARPQPHAEALRALATEEEQKEIIAAEGDTWKRVGVNSSSFVMQKLWYTSFSY